MLVSHGCKNNTNKKIKENDNSEKRKEQKGNCLWHMGTKIVLAK